jgi:hypothetical protein
MRQMRMLQATQLGRLRCVNDREQVLGNLGMSWLRGRGAKAAPSEVAERLTRHGLFRVDREAVSLSDGDTVRLWLRRLASERDQQVLVHRPWGTVAAVADGRNPLTVVMSDGEHSWVAAAPGSVDDQDLTPEQVEHVMLDALASSARPEWPKWCDLT